MAEFVHSGNKKKRYVQKMFDNISTNYDLLNHLLSFGLDIYWRKKIIKHAHVKSNFTILDVATGTGDIIFEMLKKYDTNIIGLDYSYNMVKIAKKKARQLGHAKTLFIQADAECLPFADNTFDILTISFGFRNIGHFEIALKEFKRVLKPNGKLLILEFSKPKNELFNKIFQYYFKTILPKLGALISRDDAYRYLPESVDHFLTRNQLCDLMITNGFKKAEINDLTMGICSIFIGHN